MSWLGITVARETCQSLCRNVHRLSAQAHHPQLPVPQDSDASTALAAMVAFLAPSLSRWVVRGQAVCQWRAKVPRLQWTALVEVGKRTRLCSHPSWSQTQLHYLNRRRWTQRFHPWQRPPILSLQPLLRCWRHCTCSERIHNQQEAPHPLRCLR